MELCSRNWYRRRSDGSGGIVTFRCGGGSGINRGLKFEDLCVACIGLLLTRLYGIGVLLLECRLELDLRLLDCLSCSLIDVGLRELRTAEERNGNRRAADM
jgi:hypothetical protein